MARTNDRWDIKIEFRKMGPFWKRPAVYHPDELKTFNKN